MKISPHSWVRTNNTTKLIFAWFTSTRKGLVVRLQHSLTYVQVEITSRNHFGRNLKGNNRNGKGNPRLRVERKLEYLTRITDRKIFWKLNGIRKKIFFGRRIESWFICWDIWNIWTVYRLFETITLRIQNGTH